MNKRKNTIWWIGLIIGLVAINLLASLIHQRFDLTEEKRYSLSKETKNLLGNLDDQVQIEVFLKGDFPANFKKLTNSVREFLQECKEYSGNNLQIAFVDAFKYAHDSAATFLKQTRREIAQNEKIIIRDSSESIQDALKQEISKNKEIKDQDVIDYYSSYLIDSISKEYNIAPYTLQAPSKVGDEQTIKQVLPGAVIHYKDKSIGIDLLKGLRAFGTEPEQLAKLYNNAEASMEYKFASSIQKVTAKQKPSIGYVLGNGEGWGYNVDDAVRTLFRNYNVDTVNVKTAQFIPKFDALVILKPTIPFSNSDKLKIDQYITHGGRVFWMIDNMYAEYDSLYKSQGFVAFDRGLDLEDILFNYGTRINQALLQDMQCDKLPNYQNQNALVDWPFFPILDGTNHPISKNLDGVRSIFPTTLDTVETEGIRKTLLLVSSSNARILTTPAKVDFTYQQIAPDIREFQQKNVPVAVLLEGKFHSLYSGRLSKAFKDSMANLNYPFLDTCDAENKMIVVADGDLAMNQYSPNTGPLPMGTNAFTHYTYSNKEFFMNCLDYLVNPTDILKTRAKQFTLRLLDPKKASEEKTQWQLVTIALPIILIIIFGIIYQQFRRYRFTGKAS